MDEITVVPSELRRAEINIADLKKKLDTDISALQGRLRRIHWVGDDYLAYQKDQAQLTEAVNRLNKTLGKVSVLLGNAGLGYERLQRFGEQLFGGGSRTA